MFWPQLQRGRNIRRGGGDRLKLSSLVVFKKARANFYGGRLCADQKGEMGRCSGEFRGEGGGFSFPANDFLLGGQTGESKPCVFQSLGRRREGVMGSATQKRYEGRVFLTVPGKEEAWGLDSFWKFRGRNKTPGSVFCSPGPSVAG